MQTGPAAVTSPRWRPWALAAPWLVALGIGVAALVAGPRSAALPAPAAAAPAASPTSATTAATPMTATTPTTAAAAVRLDPATTALVLAEARTAIGTHGLTTAAPGTRDRWVLDQVVGDPVADGDGTAVVVVHATVITRGTTGWAGPTIESAAVTVRLGPPVEVGPAELLPASGSSDDEGPPPDAVVTTGPALPAPGASSDEGTTTTPPRPTTTPEDQ